MMNPRQSSLPAARDTRGVGEQGLPMLHMGRVIAVNARSVDVMLDDLTVLNDVPVMGAASGPDRDSIDLPAPRSLVGVMYGWGSRMAPVVMGVFDRGDRTVAGAEYGLTRRVWPSGTHVAVRKSGTIEIGMADGSTLSIGLDEPGESHVEQKQESKDGNPMADPAAVSQTKPAPFQLVLSMADGSKLEFRDKNWTVTLAKDARIEAVGNVAIKGKNVTVEASETATVKAKNSLVESTQSTTVKGADVTVEATGSAKLKGTSVTVEASGICDVKGLLVKLNGGSQPVARVGDLVSFGVIAPSTNLTVLA